MTTEPLPRPAPAAARRSAWGGLVVVLGALIAVGGLGFAAGRMTAPATASSAGGGRAAGAPGASFAPSASGGPGGLFGGALTGLSVSGTVRSVTGDTLTLETSDGQTVQVGLSGTTYHGQTAASASDVSAGSKVVVQLSGGAGGPPGAGASASPGTVSGTRTFSATDVTIVTP